MGETQTIRAPLTPKHDRNPHIVKIKVFWLTKRHWTKADILDYQKSVKGISEQLIEEQYWSKDGNIHRDKFTCEDFAIRVLCQYAASKGLPVKLTTGAGVYRNMELYDPEKHDRYTSDMLGFSERAMLTYGAPDMQRVGVNTVAVGSADELKNGDILAKTHDLKGQATGGVAHHIQLVVEKTKTFIFIYQGNSNDTIHWPTTWIYRLLFKNVADPQDSAYAGTPVEKGVYIKVNVKWNYENKTTGNKENDALKYYDLFRWNFLEFNR